MLNKLVHIALEAGKIIMPYYEAKSKNISLKCDGSPVTLADQEAETYITEQLHREFKDIPIIAEEAVAKGTIPAFSNRFFLVDPLDGTKEFINGRDEFTVNIALIEDKISVMGVIYAPALGLLYCGSKTEQAQMASLNKNNTLNWKKISVPIPQAINDQTHYRILTSKSHLTSDTATYLKKLPIAEKIEIGSSLKFCKIADGTADIYPRLGPTMEWDTAAGDAIVKAAGGYVTCLDGTALLYGKTRSSGYREDFLNPDFIVFNKPLPQSYFYD